MTADCPKCGEVTRAKLEGLNISDDLLDLEKWNIEWLCANCSEPLRNIRFNEERFKDGFVIALRKIRNS